MMKVQIILQGRHPILQKGEGLVSVAAAVAVAANIIGDN
jgi:hypothetical protein